MSNEVCRRSMCITALIHSRLDYCNGLFAGLPDNQMTRLQSVLRSAARLIIQVPSRAPVSGVMRDVLHWLSFPQRVTFKLCLLIYKCLHGLAPQYLSRCCIPLAAVPEHLHQHWVRAPSTRLVQHLGTLYRRHFDTRTWLSASSSGSWRQFYFRGCRTLDFFTTRAYVTFALTVRVEMTVYLLTYWVKFVAQHSIVFAPATSLLGRNITESAQTSTGLKWATF